MIDPTSPAFPLLNQQRDGIVLSPEEGLTKREWFAGLVLEGLLACGRPVVTGESMGADSWHFARAAVNYADALIEELSK